MAVLTNMVTILMIPAKLATIGLLVIKIIKNKIYGAIVSIHEVTNNSFYLTQIILPMWSCDQTLVTLPFL